MSATRMAFVLLLGTVAAAAQPTAVKNSELPPRIAALVPPGTKVTSQSFTGAATLAAATFAAEKALPEGRSSYYDFSLNAFDANAITWKMREPIYRAQMDEKIAKERQGVSFPATTADTPRETKYGWGSGVTQRLVHHPPQAKEYTDYRCAYLGMIGGVMFELKASGLPEGCSAADQWAANVASAAAKISVSNIDK